MRMLLSEIFVPQSIILNLKSASKEEAFIELVDVITAVHSECDGAVLLEAIQKRENKMNTGIASGVALPHAFCSGINNMIGAIGLSRQGIDYNAPDDKPVHVVFMLAMSEPARENHLRILNEISRLAQSDSLMQMRNAENAQTAHAILTRFNN